jgi:hypothetical protein
MIGSCCGRPDVQRMMLVQVTHLIWFIHDAQKRWADGVNQAYALTNISETQYWLERVGLWLSMDFQIQVSRVLQSQSVG